MKQTIYILSFISLLQLSCEKFLDIKSQNNYVTPNTIENIQALLDDNYTMNRRFPDIAEASADNYFYPNESYVSLNEKNRKIYTWMYDEIVFNNDWAKSYSAIYQANLALDEIVKLNPSAAQLTNWKNVRGSAHFYRAYQNLFLLWTYANAYNKMTASQDLGIVLRKSSDPNILSQRSSVEECYTFVIEDLKKSISDLPLKSKHVMRPSRISAYAALARTYLSMGNYEQALAYADTTLQFNKELMDFNSSSDVNLNNNLPFPMFNKEILFYGESSNSNSIISPLSFFVDTLLYQSFKVDDLRKQAYFQNTQKYPRFKGAFSVAGQITFLGITVSEIYLIKSECLIRKGEISDGLDVLNSLLKMRYNNLTFQPYRNESKSEVLTLVLEERRKELIFRGLRWMDIKRLNVENPSIYLTRIIQGKEISLEPNSKRFALQLPQDIIELTRMPQNEF